MPVRLFVAWTEAASRRAALSQLRQTEAVSLGAASVLAGKEGRGPIRRAKAALMVAAGVIADPDDEA